MNRRSLAEDPEPSEPGPAGLLLVPVRPGPLGHAARLFRTPLGDRTAVAFTTEQQLVTVLGTAQPWITLAEPALRALTEPLGVTALTVDPQLAAAPAAAPRRTGAPDRPLVVARPYTGAPGLRRTALGAARSR
ncbi:SAV_915 family protein [Kitasatospora sp. NBC_00458]|uniref:SAV_915 family protein n=1 Tax=Kitasatospora sp. NBC_00458 TaxID=2903568 RepID=UPI002E189100